MERGLSVCGVEESSLQQIGKRDSCDELRVIYSFLDAVMQLPDFSAS